MNAAPLDSASRYSDATATDARDGEPGDPRAQVVVTLTDVTAQFEAKKREQARLIIEKRQAAMEFRLKRERQKEVELQAEFVFARKAEEARIRKDELIEQKRIATQAAMREKGAAFKQKHKAKLARIAAEALELQENSDVMALEKEKIIEEKHKALKKRVRESQKITVELNAARAAEQVR